MRRIRVRWARVLVVVLAGVAVAAGRESAALRADLVAARCAQVHAPIVDVGLPCPPPVVGLPGYRVTGCRLVGGRPTLELESSPGASLPIVPALAPTAGGEWAIVDFELGFPVTAVTLEWREAMPGAPSPALGLEVHDVQDLLREDERALPGDGCAWGPAPPGERRPGLSADQLDVVLRAITGCGPDRIEVHWRQLVVQETAAGQARVRAALAALRRAAAGG